MRMTEQPGSGTLTGAADGTVGPPPDSSPVEHAAAQVHESVHGRPVSWIAVTVIVIGFLVGGVGFVPHPTWWLFWTGVGIALLGICFGGLNKMTEDWY
jgi:hypothetical protein